MNKLNDLLEKLARPLKDYSSCLLRIGLGVSFFLHGYGKIPIQQGFVDWLASKGIPFADLTAFFVAWGEMLAGIGILIGGAVMVIMIGALLLAHSDWAIFIGERGSVLFASEQLFLLLLGTYFAIKGNSDL